MFEHENGAFMHEPLTVEAENRRKGLARAAREGVERAFGRGFPGLSRFELSRGGPIPVEDLPTTEVRPNAKLIAVEDVPPTFEPPRHAVLEGLDAVRWWAIEGAFGPASELGVALARCASEDETLAQQNAELAGEWIAHQMTRAEVEAMPVSTRELLFPEGFDARVDEGDARADEVRAALRAEHATLEALAAGGSNAAGRWLGSLDSTSGEAC